MSATLRAPALASTGAGVYTHTQDVSDTTWTITHNLGHYPAGITVRLLSGEIVEPDRDDLDINTTVLTFGRTAAGLAELI